MQDKQNKQVKDDDDELLQELKTNEPFQKKKILPSTISTISNFLPFTCC
jgi:hypothetical protein